MNDVENITNAILGGFDKNIIDINNIIHSHKQNITYYNNQAENEKKEIINKENLIKKLNLFIENSDKIKNEISKSISSPYVDNIEIYQDNLLIITKDIYFKNKVLAGKFKIAVNFSNQSIRFFNLTHVVRHYHHPHIDDAGFACMGNLAGSIVQCILEYKISALITICVNYLQSYNNSGAYVPFIKMSEWRVVKNRTPVKYSDIKRAYKEYL